MDKPETSKAEAGDDFDPEKLFDAWCDDINFNEEVTPEQWRAINREMDKVSKEYEEERLHDPGLDRYPDRDDRDDDFER